MLAGQGYQLLVATALGWPGKAAARLCTLQSLRFAQRSQAHTLSRRTQHAERNLCRVSQPEPSEHYQEKNLTLV